MKVEVLQVHYKESVIHFMLEEDGHLIEYQGVFYYSLNDFLSAYPSLLLGKELKILVLLTNFFFSGLQYSFIEDVAAYQKKYEKRIQEEKTKKTSENFPISQYGHFDVSVIKPPELKDGILTYFVENVNFGIPYKVECQLSAQRESNNCSYSLLSRHTS